MYVALAYIPSLQHPSISDLKKRINVGEIFNQRYPCIKNGDL